MIHDIEPYRFHNEYHNTRPEAGDFVLSVRDNAVLLAEDLEGDLFPKYGDLPDAVRKEADPIYLFAIDELRFFLCWDLALPGYTYRDGRTLRRDAPRAPRHLVYAALVGLQLARWYEDHRYCGRCRTALVPDDKERMLRCPACGLTVYPRINPCVIVGVIHDGKLLVSQYKNGFRDRYALTAGFAEVGETIEETAAREVYEETHQRIRNLRFYKSQPWPLSDSLLFGFFAELDVPGEIVIQEDEISMAKWVTPEEIHETPDNFALTTEMICRFRDGDVPF